MTLKMMLMSKIQKSKLLLEKFGRFKMLYTSLSMEEPDHSVNFSSPQREKDLPKVAHGSGHSEDPTLVDSDLWSEDLSHHLNVPKNSNQSVIPSYGVILFCMVDHIPHYLIYQRRDTYEYMDIIRGNWNTEARFFELFSCICEDEKNRIRDYTFTELWVDMWMSEKSCLRNDFITAKQKYQNIKPRLQEVLLDSGEDLIFSLEPPWGFPKGKKINSREKDIDCAIREFVEETNISASVPKLWNIDPYIEKYKGNNGKMYTTSYFLAESKGLVNIKYTLMVNLIRPRMLSNEANDAKWMTYDDACKKLHPRRVAILKKISQLIDAYYNKLSPFIR